MSGLTPRQKREAFRADFADMLRDAMHELRISQDDLAEEVGTEQQKVSLWTNRKSPVKPQAQDVALFPSELAARVLSWLANQHKLDVVPRDAKRASSTLRELTKKLMVESHEGVEKATEYALTNDPRLLPDVLRELEEKREATDETIAYCREAHAKYLDEKKAIAMTSSKRAEA